MIKGINGIHHIAVSVPDLAAAEAFYCGVIGFEVKDRFDFSATADGDAVLALENGSAKSILLNCGNVYLEVFEFLSPDPKTQDSDRPVCDHGYTHIAFDVDDVYSAYHVLADAGVRWHSPPVRSSECDDPLIITYGRDPFGNVIEIQQLPRGVDYRLHDLDVGKN